MQDLERLLGGAPWGLVTFRRGESPQRQSGILTAAGVEHPPFLAAYADLDAVLRDWPRVEPALRAWEAAGKTVGEATIELPLRTPTKLLCAGANYHDHIQEMGIESVPPGNRPFFFLLPPSSLIGPGHAVRIPADPAARVDWEAELAVVVGAAARNIPVERALDHVAAFSIVNDVSARGLHRRSDPLAPPFEFDWLTSKGLDTFTPLGPTLVPAWLAPDPDSMRVRLWQNDDLRQDGTTTSMIANVAELVVAASHLMTLEPGDVIATGTPPGVGAPRGLQLADGDQVVVTIDGIGTLESPVVVDPEQRPLG